MCKDNLAWSSIWMENPFRKFTVRKSVWFIQWYKLTDLLIPQTLIIGTFLSYGSSVPGNIYIYIYTVMDYNIGTLSKYDQRKLCKVICIVNTFHLLFKNFTKI